MRDIDFIPHVLAELDAQFPRIQRRFDQENEAFKKLVARDHDSIGRVLKCHLIIENYINRHLESVGPSHNWHDARLHFSQKLKLLPRGNPKVAWLLAGLKEINLVRNRFGHRIQTNLSPNDLTGCTSVLAVARPGKQYNDPIQIIEDFTTVACTWLIVDPEFDRIFAQASKRALLKMAAPRKRFVRTMR